MPRTLNNLFPLKCLCILECHPKFGFYFFCQSYERKISIENMNSNPPTILAQPETLFFILWNWKSKTKMRLSALGTRMSNLKLHFDSYLQKKLRVMLTKHELYLMSAYRGNINGIWNNRAKKFLPFYLPLKRRRIEKKKWKYKKKPCGCQNWVMVCTYENAFIII